MGPILERDGPTSFHWHERVGPDGMGLRGWFQGPRLTKSETTQTTTSYHIQGFESTHPNIYPIYDLQEPAKELAL